MSNFLTAAMSFLILIAAYLNFKALIFVRMTQGIIRVNISGIAIYLVYYKNTCIHKGFCWPAIHNLISQWIPPNERSRFSSAYIGGSVGFFIFYPLFGFIISISSWEWIFHISTALSIIWFICWQYFVYDSPSKYPRIDPSELNYITKSLGDAVENDNKVRF